MISSIKANKRQLQFFKQMEDNLNFLFIGKKSHFRLDPTSSELGTAQSQHVFTFSFFSAYCLGYLSLYNTRISRPYLFQALSPFKKAVELFLGHFIFSLIYLKAFILYVKMGRHCSTIAMVDYEKP